MILRVERIDDKSSMTFDVDTLPNEKDLICFGGKYYQAQNIIKFAAHTLALVKQVNVLKLKPSQILRKADNE